VPIASEEKGQVNDPQQEEEGQPGRKLGHGLGFAGNEAGEDRLRMPVGRPLEGVSADRSRTPEARLW
jgi:hypothetical protein